MKRKIIFAILIATACICFTSCQKDVATEQRVNPVNYVLAEKFTWYTTPQPGVRLDYTLSQEVKSANFVYDLNKGLGWQGVNTVPLYTNNYFFFTDYITYNWILILQDGTQVITEKKSWKK